MNNTKHPVLLKHTTDKEVAELGDVVAYLGKSYGQSSIRIGVITKFSEKKSYRSKHGYRIHVSCPQAEMRFCDKPRSHEFYGTLKTAVLMRNKVIAVIAPRVINSIEDFKATFPLTYKLTPEQTEAVYKEMFEKLQAKIKTLK